MGMIKIPKASREYFESNYGEIFDSGELAEGKWNETVSNWICSYTSAAGSLLTNSNGAGLFTVLQLLKEYRNKKKVFLQSNTMYGVKTLARSSGLEVCGFVDCSLSTLMPTYQQVFNFVQKLQHPAECVFLITHIGGWVNPDIEEIADLCRETGISLVEDCAHSLGSTLNGKHSGLFGVAGVYSMYATKAVPVGEGGIVVSNDRELIELASKYVIYDRFDQKLDVGVNLRMSEINALLTYSVIKETEHIIMEKHVTGAKYAEACEKNGWAYIQPIGNGQRSNLYKFIMLAKSSDPEAEFGRVSLRTSPVYDYSLGDDPEAIVSHHICLPIWYGLEADVVESVISQLRRK